MSDGCGKVLLWRGDYPTAGPIDHAICWQTRSPVCHAAILLPYSRNEIVEAMQFVGVRVRFLKEEDWKHIEVYDVIGMTPAQWVETVRFLEGEVGCGYDYRSICRFLTRKKAGSKGRWFCSELTFAAIDRSRFRLLQRISEWAVNPGHLRLSPFLARTQRP
jgi:uncharacterized protein YycO